MEMPAPVTVVHLTSVHVLTDIRIHKKECTTLAQAGYDVVLVGPGESRPANHPGEARIVGVKRPRNRFERIILTTWRVFRAGLQQNGVIYHGHDPELLPWLILLKLLGRIVIFDMHEDMPNSILARPWIPSFLRRPCSLAYRYLERALLSGMSVICVVESMASAYSWITDLTLVRNFPILGEMSKINEPVAEKFTIAYIGRVYRERGSETLLKAARICKDRGIDTEIDLVGFIQDDHRRELQKLIREPGLENIRIHGPLLPEESWKIAARCHLGAALIQFSSGLMNILPTKALEYMALGKPVLASNLPLLRYMVEATGAGICVPADDPEAVANAIAEVARNPEHWRESGRRARKYVSQKWTWEQESRKLLRLYKDLLVTRAHHQLGKEARFLVFRMCPENIRETAILREGITTEVWRPSLTSLFPPQGGLHSGVWWLLHQLRIFPNRDYQVFYLKQGARVVHRLSLLPRYSHWPFMAAGDLQISNTWTPSEFRGKGLATEGLKAALSSSSLPGRSFWYLSLESNTSSIGACRKAGFSFIGYARRTSLLGLRLFGRFELDTAAAGPAIHTGAEAGS
jgi:glycosyltransferase involved in cell wall biosynthesis/RimJ/RimL family protein N-acetyltransferase